MSFVAAFAAAATALPAVAATTAALPAPAPAEVAFSAPAAHGVVDLGDRVAFGFTGRCGATTAVRAEVELPSGTVAGDAARGCRGEVRLPTAAQVAAAGGRDGDGARASLVVVGTATRRPLRLQRIDVEHGRTVAGRPARVPAGDPDGGGRALELSAGDAVTLGRAELGRLDSVSVRSTGDGTWELRAGRGGRVVATGSVGGPAWKMTVAPMTDRPGGAPELVLSVRDTRLGVVRINHVDLNGSGVALAHRLDADPPGTVTLFDGSSFEGWSHVGPGRFELRDGAMRAEHRAGDLGWGWLWYTPRQFSDFVLRLRFKYSAYGENGGVLLRHADPLANPWTPIVDADEVQLFDPGEQFTGGIAHVHDATRLANASAGDWVAMEVVAVGPEIVVRVDGREVVRHVQDRGCGAFGLTCRTRGHIAVENETFTGSGGNLWYDDIRIYECRSARDPWCAR